MRCSIIKIKMRSQNPIPRIISSKNITLIKTYSSNSIVLKDMHIYMYFFCGRPPPKARRRGRTSIFCKICTRSRKFNPNRCKLNPLFYECYTEKLKITLKAEQIFPTNTLIVATAAALKILIHL